MTDIYPSAYSYYSAQTRSSKRKQPDIKTFDHSLSLPVIPDIYSKNMNARRTFTQNKKKKGKKRHFPYVKRIQELVPLKRVGLVRWVGDDYNYAPAATTGNLAFNINSCNDPAKAGGAALPQWWTEISSIYHRYTVLSCKWHLHLSNTTADQVQGAYCISTNAESMPATAAGLTECIQKGKPFWLGATDENLSNHIDIFGTWRLKDHLPNHEKDTTMGAIMGSDPTSLWVLNVVLGSASNLSLKTRMIMEFIVEVKDFQQNAPD